MKLRKKEYILISAFLLSITPALARQPRFYLPRDPGSNYITLFQRYIWASEQYNYGQKISKNMDFEKWQFSAAFTHFFEYRNRLIRLDILDSYGYVSMGKTGVTNQGFSDPLIAIGVELVEHKEQRFFLVFTQAIILPAGSYDADKGTINMGQNRWRSQSELGASKWIGKLCIEIAGNLMLFSDNNDFGASGPG